MVTPAVPTGFGRISFFLLRPRPWLDLLSKYLLALVVLVVVVT